jgi:cyclophilin family peptidyl-prolyl cis-trans isomerase
MPKRTRDKELARLAARREAERQAEQHRRKVRIATIAGVATAVVALALVAIFVLPNGDDGAAVSSSSPPPSPSPSASPSPTGTPGKQVGTVEPAVQPPAEVACGGQKPPQAGKPKPQYEAPPKITIDVNATYEARFATSCGSFTAALILDEEQPQAVNNFVFLAKQGFYDGLTFHRVAANFVIQGGDPLGDGMGGPGYEFPVTLTPRQKFEAGGTLAYAHAAEGGNGSQFFITTGPTTNLNPPSGAYTIFGTISSGDDVVRTIGALPTGTSPSNPGEKSVPKQAVYIDSIKIVKVPS